MIAGGWPFVIAAYAAAGVSLAVLVIAVVLRARHWAKLARQLDRKAP